MQTYATFGRSGILTRNEGRFTDFLVSSNIVGILHSVLYQYAPTFTVSLSDDSQVAEGNRTSPLGIVGRAAIILKARRWVIR